MANKQVHELTTAGAAADANYLAVSQSSALYKMALSVLSTFIHTTDTYDLYLPVGDQTTAITTGTAKLTFIVQRNMTITGVAASLKTAATTTVTTFDINKGGASILSTKLTIDASETSSSTAATAAVLSSTTFTAGDVVTIDFDTVGTNGIGPVVYIKGTLR